MVLSEEHMPGGAPMEADLVYFSRRAAEEKAAASRADHPNARQAHLDLAGRYEDLANALAQSHRQSSVGVSNVA